MGLFKFFGKKESHYEEEEEIEEKGEEIEANVSLDGELDFKLCKPTSFEELLFAVDYLKDKKTILLNLEGVEKPLRNRMIDFVSGASFALGYGVKKGPNYSYYIAPNNVDVSGEMFEENSEDMEFFDI